MDYKIKILALTLYGEARGEVSKVGILGLQAVCRVVVNRLMSGRFGKTIEDICLKPYQFSCWNANDPNYGLLRAPETLTNPVFKECYEVAATFLENTSPDFTRGATHYHAIHTHPFWAKTMPLTLLLGDHLFYREEAN